MPVGGNATEVIAGNACKPLAIQLSWNGVVCIATKVGSYAGNVVGAGLGRDAGDAIDKEHR